MCVLLVGVVECVTHRCEFEGEHCSHCGYTHLLDDRCHNVAKGPPVPPVECPIAREDIAKYELLPKEDKDGHVGVYGWSGCGFLCHLRPGKDWEPLAIIGHTYEKTMYFYTVYKNHPLKCWAECRSAVCALFCPTYLCQPFDTYAFLHKDEFKPASGVSVHKETNHHWSSK